VTITVLSLVCGYSTVELMRVGVYGDVSRVKIMFNKKDTALVQFADPGQAQIGDFHVVSFRHRSQYRVGKNRTILKFVNPVHNVLKLGRSFVNIHCSKNFQDKKTRS